jgi:hypothetical protein
VGVRVRASALVYTRWINTGKTLLFV